MKLLSSNEANQVKGGAGPLVWAAYVAVVAIAGCVGKKQGYKDNTDC